MVENLESKCKYERNGIDWYDQQACYCCFFDPDLMQEHPELPRYECVHRSDELVIIMENMKGGLLSFPVTYYKCDRR